MGTSNFIDWFNFKEIRIQGKNNKKVDYDFFQTTHLKELSKNDRHHNIRNFPLLFNKIFSATSK